MGNSIMRKLVAILVSLTMVLGSAAFVFAETSSPSEGGNEPANKPAAAAKITKRTTDANYNTKSIKITVKAKNAKKYKIAYRVKGGKWKYITTTKKNYTLKKLKKKGLYQIKVAGINKDGKRGKYSKIVRRYMRKSNFKVKGSKGKIKVTTKKISGISGYQIRYSKKSTMKSSKTVTVKTTKALNKTLKNLKKGTYYVQVRPIKKSGGKTYYGAYNTITRVKVK